MAPRSCADASETSKQAANYRLGPSQEFWCQCSPASRSRMLSSLIEPEGSGHLRASHQAADSGLQAINMPSLAGKHWIEHVQGSPVRHLPSKSGLPTSMRLQMAAHSGRTIQVAAGCCRFRFPEPRTPNSSADTPSPWLRCDPSMLRKDFYVNFTDRGIKPRSCRQVRGGRGPTATQKDTCLWDSRGFADALQNLKAQVETRPLRERPTPHMGSSLGRATNRTPPGVEFRDTSLRSRRNRSVRGEVCPCRRLIEQRKRGEFRVGASLLQCFPRRAPGFDSICKTFVHFKSSHPQGSCCMPAL